MARQLRFEYAGAVYHVMARGDGGKCIFPGREDYLRNAKERRTLATHQRARDAACEKTGNE